jgi:hypothetical protein
MDDCPNGRKTAVRPARHTRYNLLYRDENAAVGIRAVRSRERGEAEHDRDD